MEVLIVEKIIGKFFYSMDSSS